MSTDVSLVAIHVATRGQRLLLVYIDVVPSRAEMRYFYLFNTHYLQWKKRNKFFKKEEGEILPSLMHKSHTHTHIFDKTWPAGISGCRRGKSSLLVAFRCWYTSLCSCLSRKMEYVFSIHSLFAYWTRMEQGLSAWLRLYCPCSLAVGSRPAYLRTALTVSSPFPTTCRPTSSRQSFSSKWANRLWPASLVYSIHRRKRERERDASALEMSFHRPSWLMMSAFVLYVMCAPS